MRPSTLLARSLRHYWRTHVAVVAGVATAVAVLTGALVVGDSVRASLRGLAEQRLGRADVAVRGARFFREDLAREIAARPAFAGSFVAAAPLVALQGALTHEASGRRASGVAVYGVDERFWTLHGLRAPETGPREALPSAPLAAELGVAPGDTLLLRLERPSDVPAATLYGRRDGQGRTARLVSGPARTAEELGEFSLRPTQQSVRAVFVPLRLLQRTLDEPDGVNAVLLDALPAIEAQPAAGQAAAAVLGEAAGLADLGLSVRPVAGGTVLSVERDQALLEDPLAAAAREAAAGLGLATRPVLTYLANALRAGDREVPYSLVSGLEGAAWTEVAGDAAGVAEAIVLNDWAARDLAARPGDRVTLAYYVWLEEGRLEERTAGFTLARVTPMTGLAADRELTPEYPGITGSESLADWDPPFPIDLGRVRKQDEDYWERHRATPKAFIPLARAQELWRHRLGRLTSLRVAVPDQAAGERYTRALRAALDPLAMGFAVEPARAEVLRASEGTTDFGEYFLYFSSFLLWSALLLTALFFRFGVEQRLREVGLLRAVGFTPGRVRRGLLWEGGALAAVGALVGTAAAWAYGAALLWALRTWWVDAVGTEQLRLHASARSLVVGALAGILTALVCIALTLRGLRRTSARALLAGAGGETATAGPGARAARLAAAGTASGLFLAAASAFGLVPPTPAFFGAGLLLLASLLTWQWRWLARRQGLPSGTGARPMAWLGFRNASYRPGRSVLCVALVASATFVIVSVGAFRRDAREGEGDPAGPAGGYALVATSVLPLHHDPHTPDGREALNLADETALAGVRFARFRRQAGDDASCLNLYRPQSPTVLGATPEFLRAGRFSFQSSLAETAAERANPWLLLERDAPDGAVPVIADANSLAYVLHRKVGDELAVDRAGQAPLRLRIVAALRNGLFQGELIAAERHFLRAFPDQQGYRFLLVETPAGRENEVAAALENRLGDYGLDAVPTAERLARYFRVENTYLSMFQALGGLGLLLGTVGLGAVLLRNALERRQELALLRAVGYRRRHLSLMVLSENALLLALGLGTGTACALVAIAPAVVERGGTFPAASLAVLLAGVAAVGLLVSRAAVSLMHRAPLLAALRSE
ncbi:MAG TPA: ABC transporter permease [Vicinamibacteria bacterium]|nr:ABC transporter permease [Vicinamibacteria bacterium]